MIGKTLSHYRIVGRLAECTLGAVYEAEDTEHKRQVALVVLSERVTSRAGLLERLQAEAGDLATLDHGGIFTIHAVGIEDGVPFLAMDPLVGLGLDELIPEKGMDLDAFFTFIYPVTEALSFAHEMKATHGDLKPANILVDETGRPRLLDFGLARLRIELNADDLTMARRPSDEAGGTVGTVAYLSPEQVERRRIDPRSDIFSLGVVMYEMLTGQRPFAGTSTAGAMATQPLYAPPKITDIHPHLPQDLDRIVRLCLEQKPDDRHQTAKGLRNHLRSLQQDLDDEAHQEAMARDTAWQRPAWVSRVAAAAAAVIIIGGGWFLLDYGTTDDTADSSESTYVARKADDRVRIAVMPFANLGDPQHEYFADGLTDEITNRLASIEGLGVIARSSTLRYKGRSIPLKDIGRELGVDYVLEGTVRWQQRVNAPGRIRITPELVRVSDDARLWTSRYEGQIEKVFEAQADLATRVTTEMGFELPGDGLSELAIPSTENMEAYEAFLRGTTIWTHPDYDAEEWRRAARFYRQAVDGDPEFLEAWTELVGIYVELYRNGDGTRETLDLAAKALARAEAIDPAAPPVLVARGAYQLHGLADEDLALTEYQQAEEILPNEPAVPTGMALILRNQGALRESTSRFEQALELDPNNAALHLELARNHAAREDFDLADASYERVIALDPDGPDAYVEQALNTFRWHGAPGDALTTIDRAPLANDTDIVQSRVRYLMLARDNETAAAALEAISESYFDSPAELARYFVTVVELAMVRGDADAARDGAESGREVAEAMLAEEPHLATAHVDLAFFAAVQGDKPLAREHLRIGLDLARTDRRNSCDLFGFAPRVFLMMRDYDAAIELLDETLDTECLGRLHLNDLRLDPRWDACRDHPRLQELLQTARPSA